jgi:hypothetical protein
MFNGTIPAELRSFVHEHAKQWKVSEVWSACSGNLTTEHVLREAGVIVLHSNDVAVPAGARLRPRWTAGADLAGCGHGPASGLGSLRRAGA